jgi:hypothetical protein
MHAAARLLPILAVVPIAVLVMLVNIYPYHPSTAVGWGLLVVLSLPLMLAGEYFGERVFGAPFVARLPRAARMAYAVVILSALLAVAVFAQPLLEGHLAKWGT